MRKSLRNDALPATSFVSELACLEQQTTLTLRSMLCAVAVSCLSKLLRVLAELSVTSEVVSTNLLSGPCTNGVGADACGLSCIFSPSAFRFWAVNGPLSEDL